MPWVENMFNNYVAKINDGRPPFPLQSDVVISFIRFVALEVGYAYGTVSSVIVQVLKRLHKKYTKTNVPSDIQQDISTTLREVKSSPFAYCGEAGKEPAIAVDVKRIIEKTPVGCRDRVSEVSLWLVAHYTGARSITLSNIRLSDIIGVIIQVNGIILVQIKEKVTKGNPNSDHVVTLSGNLEDDSSMNVVFWLNKHLELKFNLSLINHLTWEVTRNDTLWGWTEAVMQSRFRKRAILAGYPKGLLTFHSLRAGFICSALLASEFEEGALSAIFEQTALVAGWVPYSPAQMTYLKCCARRMIIANNLIQRTGNNSSIMINKDIVTPELFHGITLNNPSWSVDSNYEIFYDKVKELLTVQSMPKDKRFRYRRMLFSDCLESWVKYNAVLEQEACKLYSEDSHLSQRNAERNAREIIGRADIVKKLNENFDLLDKIVKDFVSAVQDRVQNPKYKRNVKRKKTQKNKRIEAGNREKKNGRRVRKMWTEAETKFVVERVKAWGTSSWASIEIAMKSDRTNGDIKDRFRNLVNTLGSEENVYLKYKV